MIDEAEIQQPSCTGLETREEEMNTGNATPEIAQEVLTEDNGHNGCWRTYKPVDLKRPRTNVLIPVKDCKKPKTEMDPSRRRPATVVKALSSNNIANKYDLLVDKRLIIANYKENKLKNEIQFNSTEHELRVQGLKLDIEIKKETLKSLREPKI